MTTKLLEIRDRATLVPALAVRISGDDGYLARRAGFDASMIYLVMLTTARCQYDPWSWDDRTMHHAHMYIVAAWPDLKDGDVVDVEFVLGETEVKKQSESITVGE